MLAVAGLLAGLLAGDVTASGLSLGTLASATAVGPNQPTDDAIVASIVDLRADVVDVQAEAVDLRLDIEATDGSESESRTPEQVMVTLATDVLFEFGRADLTPAAQSKLAELVGRLRQARGTATVDGYTDSIGPDSVNGPLSQQRADAVRVALIGPLGGASLQLVAAGHGKADPVAPEKNPDGTDNPAGRARNRRVTVTFRPG